MTRAFPILTFLLFFYSSFICCLSQTGTNGSGQVPDIPNLAQLIDPDTPPSAQTYKSSVSGDSFHIVFSDEFETEGRTFWPGDDPYWEAVDLWYGGTGDYEWVSGKPL